MTYTTTYTREDGKIGYRRDESSAPAAVSRAREVAETYGPTFGGIVEITTESKKPDAKTGVKSLSVIATVKCGVETPVVAWFV